MNVSVVCNLVKDIDSYFICNGVEPSTCSDVIQHVIPKFVDHLKEEEESSPSKQYSMLRDVNFCVKAVASSVCLSPNILMHRIKQKDQS